MPVAKGKRNLTKEGKLCIKQIFAFQDIEIKKKNKICCVCIQREAGSQKF
jgi:hypothetical protein